jgi:class 3 adenylate cyclase
MEELVGTVTLVFIDIEGSTRLLVPRGAESYREVLDVHHGLIRTSLSRRPGTGQSSGPLIGDVL